jgi:hypothetical protein
MPERLAQRLSKSIPKDVFRKILRMTRSLGQEYRCALLDRIVNEKMDTLPKLSEFEELERAAIAREAGKVKIKFIAHPDCYDLYLNLNGYWEPLRYSISLTISR